MLNLPTIGHSITVAVSSRRIGWTIGSSASSGVKPTREVDVEGFFAVIIITNVFVIQIMTREFRRLCEPSPILLTVGQTVAVGIDITRISAVETTFASIDKAVFIEIAPIATEFDPSDIKVNSVSVGITLTVVRVSWVEAVDKFPTIRHPV